MKSKDMIMCSFFTVLIVVGAFVRLPILVIPFTLQTLFVLLSAMLLGKKAAISSFVYMLLGLVGLPIFSEGGGIWYIAKPTFGYIIGFILGSFVTGLIVEKMKKKSFSKLFVAGIIGLVCIYVVGMAYFAGVTKIVLGNEIDIIYILKYGLLATLPGDLVLCVLAVVIGKKVRNRFGIFK